MKTILLEMSEGLGQEIGFMFKILTILCIISPTIYLVSCRMKISNFWSLLLSITITICLSITVIKYRYKNNPLYDIDSIVDNQLIPGALSLASIPITIVLVIFFIRYLNKNHGNK